MITASQIRAARHAIRWSIGELAEKSKVSTSTIKRLEATDGLPSTTKANLSAIYDCLEAAGIEFIGTPDNNPGIRIRTTKPNEPL